MLQKFQIHKFNPRTVLFIMPTKTNFILFLVRAEQLKTVMLCCFMFGIRTMTFAWEQLTLLVYKSLLKCFAGRQWLLVKESEPTSSASDWCLRHWGRLEIIAKNWHSKPLSLLPIHNFTQGKHSQLIWELIWKKNY